MKRPFHSFVLVPQFEVKCGFAEAPPQLLQNYMVWRLIYAKMHFLPDLSSVVKQFERDAELLPLAPLQDHFAYCVRTIRTVSHPSPPPNGGEASEFWGGPNPYVPLTSTPLYPLSPLSCPLLPLNTGP